MPIPKSLLKAMNEDPERFANYIDKKKVKNTQTFLREFSKKFGKKQGLNILKHIRGKYDIPNKLYKEITGKPLSKKEYKSAWSALLKKDVSIQKGLETKAKVKLTEEGKTRTKEIHYTPAMVDWIKENQWDRNNLFLSREFSKRFGVFITSKQLRFKKYRVRGTKKD